MNAPAHVSSSKALFEFYEEIVGEITKFETFLASLDKHPLIKALAEEDPRSKDSAGKARVISKIALDDALDAYENVLVEISKEIPSFTVEQAPIEFYHKLLRARHGESVPGAGGNIAVDPFGKAKFATLTASQALSHLKDRVERKKFNPRHEPQSIPTFLRIIRDGVPEAITNLAIKRWMKLATGFRHMMLSEEAVVARGLMVGLRVEFEEEFSEWAEKESKNLGEESTVSGGKGGSNVKMEKQLETLLKVFGTDLTAKARDTAANSPVIARNDEINGVITALSCDTGPYALVSGKKGVGKSSVTLGFTQRVIKGDVPTELKDALIVRLNLRKMYAESGNSQKKDEISGQPMSYDMFTDRLNTILSKTAAHNSRGGKQIVLVIDEMKDVFDGGLIGPLREVEPILASALDNAKGLRLILEATDNVKSKLASKSPDIFQRLSLVEVKAMDIQNTVEILRREADAIAGNKGISTSDDVLTKIAKSSKRYVGAVGLPDSAIKILHKAAALAAVEGAKEISDNHQSLVISKQTGVSAELLNKQDNERIAQLREKLPQKVIGQPDIMRIVDKLEIAAKGLNDPNKPLCSFLSIGPTGTGKTETGEALAELLGMGKPIRIDMSKFTDKHTVSNLIGSPPGYVGYGETAELRQIADKPYSVVIFDEIEKAHPDVYNTFLSILDKGEAQLSDGTTVDFRNTIILFTSNVGAQEAAHTASRGMSGFGTPAAAASSAVNVSKEIMLDSVKRRFKPEFLNRLSGTLYYDSLPLPVAQMICRLKINKVAAFLRDRNQNLILEVSKEASDEIATEGYSKEYGARAMDRAIDDLLTTPLVKWFNRVSAETIKTPTRVVVTNIGDQFGADGVVEDGTPNLIPVNDNKDKPASKKPAPALKL